jgi:hypothetical protein
VVGFGVPLSPAKFLTFTPWYELAFSANLDTVVKPKDIEIDASDVDVDPSTGNATLKPNAVEDALSKGVEIDVNVSVPMRAGLEASFHLGKTADLNLYGMLSTLGGAFSGESVKTIGAALVIRWDDIVPAVLPKPAVEVDESCEATEKRFRACPNARHWLSPEQRGQTLLPETQTAPAPAVTPTPPAAAPTPAPPAASPAPAPAPQPQDSFPAP